MDIAALEDLFARQRAVRKIDESRPVDDALIERALRLATFAPSGGNRQPWRFIVVRDPEVRSRLSEIYDGLADARYGNAQSRTPWSRVPVLIAVCSVPRGDGVSPATSPPAASIFPAVQNLLLGLHAQGLGSVLTTLWREREQDVRQVLELPAEAEVHAILPVGWPERRLGRNRRRPVAEVTFRDRFGQPWQR